MAGQKKERKRTGDPIVAGRLRKAREAAGYETIAEAFDAFEWGISYGTFNHHDNGTRGILYTYLPNYARNYGIDLLWLLSGEGIMHRGGLCVATGTPACALGELQDDARKQIIDLCALIKRRGSFEI